MSKLAHSNQATMDEIEARRDMKDEPNKSMNVLMFDPSDYQDSIEHRAGMATHALKGAVEEIFRLSETPEGRDQLISDLEHLYGAQLALSLVTDRIRARVEAAE